MVDTNRINWAARDHTIIDTL